MHVKTNHVHLHKALSATAGQFCASDQSIERGQMPDGAGMFSRQIPAYAGYLRVTKYSPLYTKNKEYDTTA
jgi:hypothetical protein